MSFSNFLENALLNHLFGKSTYNAPTIHVALSTADPGEDDAGAAEPVAAAYARKATIAANWTTSANGLIKNGVVLTFPTATGSWGNLTHFALYDAATNGNMLAYGTLGTAKTIDSGDTPSYAVDALTVSLN